MTDTAALRGLLEHIDDIGRMALAIALRTRLPAMLDELDALRQMEKRLPQYEVQITELLAQIARLRTVTDAMVERAAEAVGEIRFGGIASRHSLPPSIREDMARAALEAALASREGEGTT